MNIYGENNYPKELFENLKSNNEFDEEDKSINELQLLCKGGLEFLKSSFTCQNNSKHYKLAYSPFTYIQKIEFASGFSNLIPNSIPKSRFKANLDDLSDSICENIHLYSK